MKKTKKLTLHRTTIALLTAPALAHAVGAASVQSVKIDTKVEPCQ